MKAITIWQPWATLIAIGAKQFETRSWATNYRGPLAIHAAKKQDRECLSLCKTEPFRSVLVDAGFERIGDLPFGSIIAIGTLMACVPTQKLVKEFDQRSRQNELAFGDFSSGRFGWQIGHVRRIEAVPVAGRQGLWDWIKARKTGRANG